MISTQVAHVEELEDRKSKRKAAWARLAAPRPDQMHPRARPASAPQGPAAPPRRAAPPARPRPKSTTATASPRRWLREADEAAPSSSLERHLRSNGHPTDAREAALRLGDWPFFAPPEPRPKAPPGGVLLRGGDRDADGFDVSDPASSPRRPGLRAERSFAVFDPAEAFGRRSTTPYRATMRLRPADDAAPHHAGLPRPQKFALAHLLGPDFDSAPPKRTAATRRSLVAAICRRIAVN